MNKCIFILIFSFCTYSANKVGHSSYQVYDNYTVSEQSKQVQVKSIYFKNNSKFKRRKFIKIPLKTYEESKKIAKNIFKVKTEIEVNGRFEESREVFGSAVYLGSNLFLTNLHVISPTMKRIVNCENTMLSSKAFSRGSLYLNCKKIHFCSSAIDFCLLEVSRDKKKLLPSKVDLELLINPILGFEELVRAVGNPFNIGIHVSSGYGLKNGNTYLESFNASVYHGNSGGGLFNESGQLIGLVHSKGAKDSSLGFAIKLSTIKHILEVSMRDQSIVKKINFIN